MSSIPRCSQTALAVIYAHRREQSFDSLPEELAVEPSYGSHVHGHDAPCLRSRHGTWRCNVPSEAFAVGCGDTPGAPRWLVRQGRQVRYRATINSIWTPVARRPQQVPPPLAHGIACSISHGFLVRNLALPTIITRFCALRATPESSIVTEA
jgi:hypothetical protein